MSAQEGYTHEVRGRPVLGAGASPRAPPAFASRQTSQATPSTNAPSTSGASTQPAQAPRAATSASTAATTSAAPAAASSAPRQSRRNPAPAESTIIATNKVIVYGYPQYTQPQDVLRAFKKFGTPKISKFNLRSTTLTFLNTHEAKEAVKASKTVSIYGEFVFVKPHDGKDEVKEARQGRTFGKSKQKDVIIDPKSIDLCGDFHQQLDNVLAAVRLTTAEVAKLGQLYSDLEAALNEQWPGCTAVPFGSITTGLGIKSSDADCFMDIPPAWRQPHANFIPRTKRILQQYPTVFTEVLSIPRANTPIVKFFHVPTATNCDVTFKTSLGAQNSKLIAFLLYADARLVPVAVAAKYWAKVHGLTGTGRLTNYALTLLLVFYLQQSPIRCLPPISSLQIDPRLAVIVDGWNTGCDYRPEALAQAVTQWRRNDPAPPTPPASIYTLLGGFFDFYSSFDFDELVVCPYSGRALRKDEFRDTATLGPEWERYKMNVLEGRVHPLRHNTPVCVQDPFEQCHNVASSVSVRLATELRAYFRFAAAAYERDRGAGPSGGGELLPAVLLQRPRVVKERANPEYRVQLFPRLVAALPDREWKCHVRDVVLLMFRSMLKTDLGKLEEKLNPDSRKERERYAGELSKAVWRRKPFLRLYESMNLSVEERQARITEEIIAADRQNYCIRFQLTLTFCHEPRSAVVSVKLSGGDADAFKEFGKFYISVMQSWFSQLIKARAPQGEPDTAAKIAQALASEPPSNSKTDKEKPKVTKKQRQPSGSRKQKHAANGTPPTNSDADQAQSSNSDNPPQDSEAKVPAQGSNVEKDDTKDSSPSKRADPSPETQTRESIETESQKSSPSKHSQDSNPEPQAQGCSSEAQAEAQAQGCDVRASSATVGS